jgi:methionyl-tRNA synthetase
MLMAGGIEPPEQVWAHGFLTVGGQKMSKTNATGIHPFELVDHFGVDSYRYFFIREIQFGQDGSFSWESMVDRHNADLANGLGNLASRILAMLAASFDGVVPEPEVGGVADDLPAVTADAARRYDEHMAELALTQGLAAVWEIVGRANRYLVERQPWSFAKDEARQAELAGILYASAETLRILAILIGPIMPGAATRLWEQLGIEEPLEDQLLPHAAAWGGLRPGTKTVKGDALFPRLDS